VQQQLACRVNLAAGTAPAGASENETGHANESADENGTAIANANISAVATMKTMKVRRQVPARHVGNINSAVRRATILTIRVSGVGVTMMNVGGGRGGRGRGDGCASARRRGDIVMLWRDGGGRGRKRRSRLLRRRLRSGIVNGIGMGIVGGSRLRMGEIR
jgi:hypothetical protein